MTATVKAKAKFSSRNLNAVYKAPPSKTLEHAGANHVGNRMVVLRPAASRGGLVHATPHAVAAPTPINTPSLRKENRGQDVNKSIVPNGRSGWIEAVPMSVDAGDLQTSSQHTAAAGAVASDMQSSSGVWSSPTPSSASTAKTASPLVSSGRWGDDEVEQDIVASDIQRERKKEHDFPELPDAGLQRKRSNQDVELNGCHGDHASKRNAGFENGYRSERQYASLYPPQNGCTGHFSHGNPSGYTSNESRYDCMRTADSEMSQRPFVRYREPTLCQDSRHGYFQPHHSDRQHYKDDNRPYDSSCNGIYRTDRGSLAFQHHDQVLYSRSESHHDIGTSSNVNQADGSDSFSRVSTETSWRQQPKAVDSPQRSVWKNPLSWVSSGESASVQESANTTEGEMSPALTQKSMPMTQPPNTQQFRILQRPGPKKLFDPKSGKMIDVECTDNVSSKRRTAAALVSQKEKSSRPARHHDLEAKSSSASPDNAPVEKSKQLSKVPSVDADSNDSDPTANCEISKNAEFAEGRQTIKIPLSSESEHESLIKKSTPKQSGTVPHSSANLKSKRVILTSKTKKMVLKYRPVVKRDANDEASSLIADSSVSSEVKKLPDQPRLVKPAIDTETTKNRYKGQSSREKKAVKRSDNNDHVISRREFTEDHKKSSKADNIRVKNRVKKTTSKDPSKESLNASDASSHSKESEVLLSMRPRQSELDIWEHLPAGGGVIVLTEAQKGIEFLPDDPENAFETVKSRRTLMLERKRQKREAATMQFRRSVGAKHGVGIVVSAPSRRTLRRTLVVEATSARLHISSSKEISSSVNKMESVGITTSAPVQSPPDIPVKKSPEVVKDSSVYADNGEAKQSKHSAKPTRKDHSLPRERRPSKKSELLDSESKSFSRLSSDNHSEVPIKQSRGPAKTANKQREFHTGGHVESRPKPRKPMRDEGKKNEIRYQSYTIHPDTAEITTVQIKKAERNVRSTRNVPKPAQTKVSEIVNDSVPINATRDATKRPYPKVPRARVKKNHEAPDDGTQHDSSKSNPQPSKPAVAIDSHRKHVPTQSTAQKTRIRRESTRSVTEPTKPVAESCSSIQATVLTAPVATSASSIKKKPGKFIKNGSHSTQRVLKQVYVVKTPTSTAA